VILAGSAGLSRVSGLYKRRNQFSCHGQCNNDAVCGSHPQVRATIQAIQCRRPRGSKFLFHPIELISTQRVFIMQPSMKERILILAEVFLPICMYESCMFALKPDYLARHLCICEGGWPKKRLSN
jgi:hypothetical protein